MKTVILETENAAPNYFGKILGIKATNTLQLVKSIERGFSFQTLERMRRETGLPMERLAISIGISPRTLTRRKKENKLTAFESDRLVTVSRLMSLAVELFEGNKTKAFQWFTNSNRAWAKFFREVGLEPQ